MYSKFATQKRQKRAEKRNDRLKKEHAKQLLASKMETKSRPHGSFFNLVAKGVAAAKRAAKTRRNISARAKC